MQTVRLMAALLALLALLIAQPAEAKDKRKKKPSPKEVHKAVQAGSAWLRTRYAEGFETERKHSVPELVLLTLHHAQVDRKDPVFIKALATAESCELTYTYRVATLAMALSRLNPYKYRARLAHCAQWLVDSQLPGGDWGYPGTVEGRSQMTRALKVKPPVTEEEAKGGPKAEPIVIERKLPLEKLEGQHGDFSNTQYALLGLRACRDARITIPAATWQAALDYAVKVQQGDGSWGYDRGTTSADAGYASLTAAGACGAAICLNGLKKSPKSHAAVKRALAWLKRAWVPDDNAGISETTYIPPSTWHCYHLYAVERVGRLLGIKKLGRQDWYKDGAWWLLDNQESNGSWNDTRGDTTARRPPYLQTADTCFAILFLTLSTPPLTGG